MELLEQEYIVNLENGKADNIGVGTGKLSKRIILAGKTFSVFKCVSLIKGVS